MHLHPKFYGDSSLPQRQPEDDQPVWSMDEISDMVDPARPEQQESIKAAILLSINKAKIAATSLKSRSLVETLQSQFGILNRIQVNDSTVIPLDECVHDVKESLL